MHSKNYNGRGLLALDFRSIDEEGRETVSREKLRKKPSKKLGKHKSTCQSEFRSSTGCIKERR